MRRYLRPTIVIAVMGLAFGAIYRYLFDPPDEAELANYLRSSLHGAGVTLAAWAVQLYFTSRSSAWVRRWPLVVELVIRSVVMAVAVATVTVVGEAVIYPYGVDRHWLVSELPFILALTFAFSILISAIYELIRLVGGRVLVNFILGRYRRPVREQRVLLFLDLAGSTTLAEQMGELRVQDLLTRFFFDIDEAIVTHGGEVHAYVGDEVIVTWPVGARPQAELCRLLSLRSRTASPRWPIATSASSAWCRNSAPASMPDRSSSANAGIRTGRSPISATR